MITAIEELYVLFPPWLTLIALVAELLTFIQVWYWTYHKRVVIIRPWAVVGLIAAFIPMCLLYIAVILIPAEVSLLTRGAVFRILTFVIAAGIVHLFIDYWLMTWRAIRDHS